MRCFFINILFVCAALFSCTGHSHSGDSAAAADLLCAQVYDARYKDIALTDSLAQALDNLSAGNHELDMVATNSRAYSALMKMDYATAVALYEKVLAEAD